MKIEEGGAITCISYLCSFTLKKMYLILSNIALLICSVKHPRRKGSEKGGTLLISGFWACSVS